MEFFDGTLEFQDYRNMAVIVFGSVSLFFTLRNRKRRLDKRSK